MSDDQIPKYSGPRSPDRLMTRDEIRARFNNETASVYSQKDPLYLPEYADIFELLISCVAGEIPRDANVLDIGAGTGNLTLRLLRRDAGCSAVLLDFSDNMLAAVPEVLRGFEGRYSTICGDFFNADFPPASFNAVISSFAIHHARGKNEYQRLYSNIRKWLRPNGIFACVDVVEGGTRRWSDLNEEGWKKYLAGHFDSPTIDHIFSNYHSEDSPLSLPDHLACLKAAGFGSADILWKRYNFALYCAAV